MIHNFKRSNNVIRLFQMIKDIDKRNKFNSMGSSKSNQTMAIDDLKRPFNLSKLEKTLLSGICNGLSSNELGKIIKKSPRTVEDYRKSLYNKFGVQNKAQLIVKAVSLNLV